ncbi:MAG: hypothetical protein COA79_03845 [Planctomycetota bacterium]|nr:MAG: hypothetical protein COA79_03845 [Planctomycetota bacterium]
MIQRFTPIEEKRNLTLSADQIDSFNKNGFVIIRGLYTEEEIELIINLRDESERKVQVNGESFKIDRAFYDVEKVRDIESEKSVTLRKIQEVYSSESDFRKVSSSNKILDIVQDLIGDTIYYHSSKLMCKNPGGRRKPWHQDYAYWPDMNNTNQVTVWAAIEPSTRENGCIQIIPGSHKRGLIDHYQGEDYMINEDNIENENIEYAVMEPGDILFFNVLALHASDPNCSDKPRLATIIDFDSNPKPHAAEYGDEQPLRC